MPKQQPIRQPIRKGVILTTFLRFPIIMNYFAPYILPHGFPRSAKVGLFEHDVQKG